MVCFRTRRLAAGLFVFSALLGACGKKDEGKGAGGKGGASAVDNKDLDTIPVESDVVLSVDLAQAQQSALFREQVQPMMTRSGDLQKVTELLKTKCNLDPMTAATRLTAGVKLLDGRNADVVAVLHGIEKAKAMPCLDQLKAELAAEKVEVTTDGDVVMLKGGGADLAFTFTGDKTAVVVLGPKANKAGVLEAAAGKSPLRTSKAFTEMYSRIQTSHTAWAMVRGDADLVRKNLDRLSVRADAIYGSAKVTDGLELHGQIRVPDPGAGDQPPRSDQEPVQAVRDHGGEARDRGRQDRRADDGGVHAGPGEEPGRARADADRPQAAPRGSTRGSTGRSTRRVALSRSAVRGSRSMRPGRLRMSAAACSGV